MCVRPWMVKAVVREATTHAHGAVYGSRHIIQFVIPSRRGEFLRRAACLADAIADFPVGFYVLLNAALQRSFLALGIDATAMHGIERLHPRSAALVGAHEIPIIGQSVFCDMDSDRLSPLSV